MIRALAHSCLDPKAPNWLSVYARAEQQFGSRTGLPLVNGLAQITVSLLRIKADDLQILPSSESIESEKVLPDERLILLMIHHMRRNHFIAGYDFLMELLLGEVDDELLEQAHSFANRHSCGEQQPRSHKGIIGKRLRLVPTVNKN
ncbi:hypothetical protein FME95_02535 [Reinekea thalattae]|uniref:Uncharacterized protein n=2 Tax=Reinekea thalattae TaxID=2593301 RepID=A0A5C8ZA10_9GAMM|nr:hypothetical protein FME95_02535 [Reinekea thalattae]